MTELHTFTLPAGTVCQRNGIPFRLQHATQIECHPDNWELIRDGFKPSIAGKTLEHDAAEPPASLPATTSSAAQLLKAAGCSLSSRRGPAVRSSSFLASFGASLKRLGEHLLTRNRK